MKIFFLPDIGEGLQESEIVSWHVSPGDHVVADQPLVSVETDKAVVELPAPWSGTIARLCGEIGDIVAVGAPLVEFEDGAENDAGAIVGRLESASAGPAKTQAAQVASTIEVRTHVNVTPAVRAYANQRGIDLGSVRGSGPGGTIVRSDIDAAATALSRLADGFEPIKGARRALAANMTRAGRTVVPATVTDLVDITAWWRGGADITARALSAVAAAAVWEPALNAWFDGDTLARKLHENIDIGLAIDAPDGLFVPVIRDVGELNQAEIRNSIDELAKKARSRTLTPEDLQGPTITASNFGGIAGRHASLVLMPPQVAIVGVGRTETALRLENGVVEQRTMLPVSLTFDHRAVTGGEAARFLRELANVRLLR
jgi:pyruvate dehydrogenase E2 component (dihydrolipoamide acetyltransferase)